MAAVTFDEMVAEGLLLRAKTGKLSLSKNYQEIYSEMVKENPNKAFKKMFERVGVM